MLNSRHLLPVALNLFINWLSEFFAIKKLRYKPCQQIVHVAIILFCAGLCQGANTLMDINIGASGGSFSTTGAGTQMSYRLEMYVQSIAASKTYAFANSTPGGIVISTDSGANLTEQISAEGQPGGPASIHVTVGQSYRIRFQHDAVGLVETLEVWNPDGTGYTKSAKTISAVQGLPIAAPWFIGASATYGFFRLYSTLISDASIPVDRPSSAGDMFDFPFEDSTGTNGTLASRTNGYTMTASGATFTSTTIPGPHATISFPGVTATSQGPTFKIGSSITGMVGTSSVGFGWPGTGAVASSTWSITSGTATIASGGSTGTPTFNCTITGANHGSDSTAQLVVSDGTNTDTATQHFGCVETDANNIVQIANSDFKWALSQGFGVPMFGTTPWPWEEVTASKDLDLMNIPTGASINITIGPGTVRIPATNPIEIIGSGTDFTAADDFIGIIWDPDGDGSNRGRAIFAQAGGGFIDSAHWITSSFQMLEPSATFAAGGLQWFRLTPGSGTCASQTATIGGGQVTAINVSGCSGFHNWSLAGFVAVTLTGGGGSGCNVTGNLDQVNYAQTGGIVSFSGLPCGSGYTSPPTVTLIPFSDWNSEHNLASQQSWIFGFYEAPLSAARMWQSTGLDFYKTEFHNWCDQIWRYETDSGYGNNMLGRNWQLNSLIACASDPTYTAPPFMWAGIERLTMNVMPGVFWSGGEDPGYNPTHTIIQSWFDPRESSYGMRTSASLAMIGGNHGLNQANWCGYLANQITNQWIPGAAQPFGFTPNMYSFFPNSLFTGPNANPGFPAAPIGGVMGTSPWRDNGLPSIGLTMAYDALTNPSGCNSGGAYTSLGLQMLNPAGNGGVGSGLLPQLANYIWSFGRAPDGGVSYDAGYATNPFDFDYMAPFAHFNGQSITYAGGGATAVVGNVSNMYFTRMFATGDTIQIGPQGGGTPTNCTVASVTDDTHLTLNNGCAAPAVTTSQNFGNIATIDVTSGSPNVVGHNTHFTTTFTVPYDYIGIVSPSGNGAFQVTVVDDFHLTLNANWTGSTTPGIQEWGMVGRGNSNCPLSLTATCGYDGSSGRNLSADIAHLPDWLFAKTRASQWKDHGDYFLNKLFGGPAGGQGATGPPTGTSTYSPGTIDITNGSPNVVGHGTHFTTQFSNGSTFVIPDCQPSVSCSAGALWSSWGVNPQRMPTFHIYTVLSVTNDTTMALTANYAGTTTTGTNLFYNPADLKWSGADGDVNNLGEMLTGVGSFIGKYGKGLGMTAGSGNVPVAMAMRLGTPSPPPASSPGSISSSRSVFSANSVKR